jgi:tripartite-type tricarboxylate transporter receptor subunit TctC
MTLHRRNILKFALAAVPLGAAAQGLADRPVKIIVNFAAGGPLDVMARVLAENLGPRVGRPVVVENLTGANGNIGAQAVARAPADGHTLLFTVENALTVSPHIYPSLGYQPLVDLDPLNLVGAFELVLAVPASSGIKTVQEFVSRARGGKTTYASAGNGSPGHLAFLAFAERAGIQATHVPYRGNAPAMNDLMAGHVDSALVVMGGVRPHLQGGKLVALAVSGKERSPDLPQVPTLEQAGFPGFHLSYAYAIAAPKGLAPGLRSFWQDQLRQSLAVPAVQERLRKLDTRIINGDAAAARSWLEASSRRWGKTLKDANVKVD